MMRLEFAQEDYASLVEALLAQFPGPAWLTDRRGRVRLANEAARRTGTSDGNAEAGDAGLRLPLLASNQVDVDLAALVRHSASRNEPVVLEGLPFGGVRCDVRVTPLATLAAEGIILVVIDPSASGDDLAFQKAQDENLQSLTGLAARIAHELNNPLDGSIRYINLALRRLAQGSDGPGGSEKMGEYLSSARDALGKITVILSDLSSFARNGSSAVAGISVNDLVDQAIRTLSARAQSAKVSIVTTLADDLPVAGGPKLYQVFCNVLKNAMDAIESARTSRPDSAGIVTITTSKTADGVAIVFDDSGAGLPEDCSHLFEPFFTTRADRGGTGVGLAVAKEIVEHYRGCIRAENRRQGGARFVIELPAAMRVQDKERQP